MVRTRWDYIKREHSETAATGTISFDLPEKGFMPNLLLDVGYTPTGDSAQPQSISELLTKVEIVDGGLVLKALTGNQIKALSMFHGHNPLASTEINDADVAGHDQFYIPMGGLYNGTRYAPDMGRFSNPQIRLTWDASDVTTEFGVTVAADTAPALLISILAELTKDAGPYTHGYVKSGIVKEWTQAQNTNFFIEIPRGDPLIGFGIEAGYDALDWCEDVEELKLDIDNGDWIPFHLREKQIPTFQQLIYKKPFEYNFMTDLESEEEVDWHMGYLVHLALMAQRAADDPLAALAYAIDTGHKGVETVCITDVATPGACDEFRAIMCKATGWMPFHIWYCPSSFLTSGESDTINTLDFGRMEVEIHTGTSASTSNTPSVVAEYLRT